MKQKVVIRVSMGNQKKGSSKALKIAVSDPAVESASLQGPERDQIQVIGEGIDIIQIISLLKKKVGPSEILSVGAVEQKKVEEKSNDYKNVNKNQVLMMPNPFYTYDPSHYYPIYDVVPHHEPSCSIM